MAVSPEVIKKIAAYEGQGYTPDEIVAGLAESSTYRDIAAKVSFYQKKGYGASEILDGIRASAPKPEDHPLSGDTPEMRLKAMNPDMKQVGEDGTITPDWAGKYPNLYGTYGAAKEAVPIVAAAGGAKIAGPLGGASGYALGKSAVKTLETATGERPVEPLTQNLKEAAANFTEAGVAEMGFAGVGKGLKATKKLIPKSVPEKLYASATKMSTTLDPKERAARVATGLKEGILPNDKGLAKLEGLKKEMFSQIDDVINRAASPGKAAHPFMKGDTVSTQEILKRLESVKTKFSESATPTEYLDGIDRIAKDFKTFGDTIPVDKAQRIKQNIYQILKDSAYGEMKGPQKEAQKAIARGIREELEALYPDLKGLNKSASEYIRLQDSLERAVGRIQNRDIVSLGDEAMTAAGAAIGGPVGAGAVVSRKLLGLPSVKARLAIALYKARGVGAKGAKSALSSGNGAIGAASASSKKAPSSSVADTAKKIIDNERGSVGAEVAGTLSPSQGIFSPRTQTILKSSMPDSEKERFLTNKYEQASKRIRPGSPEPKGKTVRVQRHPTRIDYENDSLVTWTRKKGGIKTKGEALAGEVKNFERIDLVNNKQGRSVDELTQRAIEDGYLKEGATPSDFIDMIDEDIRSRAFNKKGSIFSRHKQNWTDDDFPF